MSARRTMVYPMYRLKIRILMRLFQFKPVSSVVTTAKVGGNCWTSEQFG